jgi:type III pantothenate kinase
LPARLLVAIDAGNTNLTVGVFDGDRLLHNWRLATRADAMPDELGLMLVQLMQLEDIAPQAVGAVAIASVVPPLTMHLEDMVSRYFGVRPLIVGPGIQTGLRILYEPPKDVGADRIVGALAAYRKYGGPAIIIDFGTATTYDAVSADGDYLGGAIAPGIETSVDALVSRAARLFRVELQAPGSAIGRNTISALQAGIVFGFVGQTEGMVARLQAELGGRARVIATGGLADLVARETRVIDTVDPLLMLEGLRIIFELNQPDGQRR